MDVFMIFFSMMFIPIGASNNNDKMYYGNPDYGGNRGYSLSFHEDGQYLGVSGYFTPSSKWPVHEMTTSAWVRITGLYSIGNRATLLTMMTRNDPNHVQPVIFGCIDGVSVFGSIVSFSGMPQYLSSNQSAMTDAYWTKVTATYNTTGTVSHFALYFNGTKMGQAVGSGTVLRWADRSTLVLGGYATTPTTIGKKRRFFGWVDDLAFYSRALSDDEVRRSWNKVADVTDPSLFIYYNFDEGPGARVIKNLGSIGAQADLQNGQFINGATEYYESDTQVTRALMPASFSPGAPVAGAIPALTPLVYAVDAGTTVALQVTCFPTLGSVDAHGVGLVNPPSIPTQATLTSYVKGNGTLTQVDASRTPIAAFPAILTNPLATFWYTAPAAATPPPHDDTIPYTCTCNGVTQTGTLRVIIQPPMAPDPTIAASVTSTTPKYFFLHGSISHPGVVTINITTLPTLGTLSQLDLYPPSPFTTTATTATSSNPSRLAISRPNTILSNALTAIKYLPHLVGEDSFQFVVMHGGLVSTPVTVRLAVSTWNFPPVIPTLPTTQIITDRKATPIRLDVTDRLQKQFLGVNILSLPTKGRLHQRLPDGSLGPPITGDYKSPSLPATPLVQYALTVANVSSFWGEHESWSPHQALGPKDCPNIAEDCLTAWCPLTMNGDGGYVAGAGQGLTYANNPTQTYEAYGYTEFIELKYLHSVRASALLVGENRGTYRRYCFEICRLRL